MPFSNEFAVSRLSHGAVKGSLLDAYSNSG
jgi:hypothetical protein